jgi:hypothetical protein
VRDRQAKTDLAHGQIPLGQELEHVFGSLRVVELDLEILNQDLGAVEPILQGIKVG